MNLSQNTIKLLQSINKASKEEIKCEIVFETLVEADYYYARCQRERISAGVKGHTLIFWLNKD